MSSSIHRQETVGSQSLHRATTSSSASLAIVLRDSSFTLETLPTFACPPGLEPFRRRLDAPFRPGELDLSIFCDCLFKLFTMLLTEPAVDVRGPRAARFPRASEAPVGEEGLDGDGLRDDSCEDTRGEPGRLPARARKAAGTATGALGATAAGGEAGAGSGVATGGGWKDGIGRSSSSSGGGSLKTGGRGGKSSVSGGGSLKTGCGGCAGFSSGGGGGTSGVGVLARGGGGGMLANVSGVAGAGTSAA